MKDQYCKICGTKLVVIFKSLKIIDYYYCLKCDIKINNNEMIDTEEYLITKINQLEKDHIKNVSLKNVKHMSFKDQINNLKLNIEQVKKNMAVNIFRDKFQSKSFQESIWNLLGTILFIYVGGFGILLTTYLNTLMWEWNIIIITTIVSVIPVVKSWISRNANIQLDELRAENMADADAWQKEKANLISEWQSKYDKLKDEISAKDIKIHMLEYDLTHPTNVIKIDEKKSE